MDTVPVYHVPYGTNPPVVTSPDSYDPYRGRGTPLIIDNGSSTLRFGFCNNNTPRWAPNIVSKHKERKTNKPLLLFGDGIDVESGAKAQARTPWEGDVLLNFDAMENALDYVFVQLGLDGSSVEHPIFMTERLASPLHSRALTSELVFELYSAPSLAYCVDGVMSYYQHKKQEPFVSDGLIVSFNTASTSVIPILNGKGIMSHAKRVPWGSSQASEYLLKLIQLKYPTFPTRVTTVQSSWMQHHFCEFAIDYPGLLRSFKDPLKLRASERIIQFPFTVAPVEEKSEEELARMAEKRREQGRKLQEMAAKTRVEKLLQKENDLYNLTELRDRRGTVNKKEWMIELQEEGFEDEASLDEVIKKLEAELRKVRKKEAEGEDMTIEEPTFPLVDVPDAELDEEGLKEKKRQKLMKAGHDARIRAKREKEREKEERETDERKEVEERAANPGEWAHRKRKEQEALMNRIKERGRRKAALGDRKSAAAQARMKNIATLAADDRVPKKKRKNGGEDTFGADDDDWAIYRKINTSAASSDEEDDLVQLQAVEEELLAHDPTFNPSQTHASLSSQRSALISAFRPQYEEGDVEGSTRIHLNTERWRVCETWFSPGMAGVDSAGLGEVIHNVLSRFDDADKGRLVNNVFLTGTPSQMPRLTERVHTTLRPILPPGIPINIERAADPSFNAWRGMAHYAFTPGFRHIGVSKAEYEEFGGERIKRWWGGNRNSSFVP